MKIDEIKYKFDTMTDRELAEYIVEYNAWRRGDDNINHPHPKDLSIALDNVSSRLRSIYGIELELANKKTIREI